MGLLSGERDTEEKSSAEEGEAHHLGLGPFSEEEV